MERKERRPRVSQQDRRQQVLELALNMSRSSQYQTITVPELAKRAGCERRVVYRALGSEGSKAETAREILAIAIEEYALTKGASDPGAMMVLTQMAAMGDRRAIAITKE